jgi:hypothetical protein
MRCKANVKFCLLREICPLKNAKGKEENVILQLANLSQITNFLLKNG